MAIRFIFLYCLLVPLSALAVTNKTLTIYHDADYSLNQVSANAMKMGLLTAFDEVNNEIQGFRLEITEKNHRGNSKRSLLSMKNFINDDKALFVMGGLHSNGIRLRECSPTEKKLAVFLIQNHPNFYHKEDPFDEPESSILMITLIR